MEIKTKFFFKQSLKKGEHRFIQEKLQALLPPGEAQIEYSFPLIGRIADIAWIQKKVIIEVQCSPISLEEVLLRNADYSRVGYEVLWILHDTNFNQKHLSAAEVFLRGRVSYFAHINEKEEVILYDQQETILKNRRLYKSARVPLSLNKNFSKIKPLCASRSQKNQEKKTQALYQMVFYFFLKKNSL